ncbi:tRNA (guanosine(37)-N1)-methyltransferase TrmD [Peptococcus simiae]|uniref:tRNA (guanine-N(1)-)-methyltransferase n=1 Tax=Peptococcus simiae TaxID=1643805 RepID=A0ABW9GWW5_9FIRM
MKIRIFSLFPEMFEGPLTASLLGKACDKGILSIEVVNFRDYALDKHRHVDDTPYGGGQGMVLMPQPLVDALEDHAPDSANSEVILLSPQGKPFSQADAVRLSKREDLAFVCGHYEGFDERIRHFVDSEYSIGDYVLTGGELPAMVMIDTIARLIPGVIKEQASYEEDSFFQGLLEYPQYTKPRDYRGMEVPEVLLSGHHANIRRWQKKEALRRTWQRRPDLLEGYPFSAEEEALLQAVQDEEGSNE